MAEFEGEKNLNRETSELEVKGKFKLSEEELDNVAGGCGDDEVPRRNGHPMVNGNWNCTCNRWPGFDMYACKSCSQYFVSFTPSEVIDGVTYNDYCTYQN